MDERTNPEIAQDFWDGIAPEPYVVQLTEILKSGSVLDLGAQKGRHAFYLADHGFQITAVENDADQLALMRADPRHDQITIVDADLRQYQAKEEFDLVIAGMVLHFLNSEDIEPAIEKMQGWTKPGGYNIVTAYTTKNPPGKRPYLFTENELADYYKSWEIIVYEEKSTPWCQAPTFCNTLSETVSCLA